MKMINKPSHNQRRLFAAMRVSNRFPRGRIEERDAMDDDGGGGDEVDDGDDDDGAKMEIGLGAIVLSCSFPAVTLLIFSVIFIAIICALLSLS